MGIVRVERYHAALEKFFKLRNLVEAPRPLPMAELPSVRQRHGPVRLFDELESARLLLVARQQHLRLQEPEGASPPPHSPKVEKRSLRRRPSQRVVRAPRRYSVLPAVVSRKDRARKRACRFRLPILSPTASATTDGDEPHASEIVMLPTSTCLTEIQLDRNLTRAHVNAVLLRRILSQGVCIAQHAYTGCVSEVTATVTGFIKQSWQGRVTAPQNHGAVAVRGAAESDSDDCGPTRLVGS